MPRSFILAIHNHQPVGNFDEVIETAYTRAYKPFLDVLESFPGIRVALHNSGCLFDWLEARHPEYLDRLARLIDGGRMELLTGAWYEPILTSIPEADRRGQILKQSAYIRNRFGSKPRGLWLAERVWEPELASTLCDAGVEYTLLDDSHFQLAGLSASHIDGYFLTEDQGSAVALLPISTELRYLIPFAEPAKALEALEAGDDRGVSIMGDDGEKFGLWPGTYEPVYTRGWLSSFFELVQASSKVETVLPSVLLDSRGPQGKVYIPASSYPEMNLWMLPAEAQAAMVHQINDGHAQAPGNTWRSFFSRYPESDHMNKRVLDLGRRLQGLSAEQAAPIREHLWAAQCNCAYWHGVFGGLYLPHLRQGIYSEMLSAERLLDETQEQPRVRCADYDADGDQEWFMNSPDWSLVVSPAEGGSLQEASYKPLGLALGNGMTRRYEAYHAKLSQATSAAPTGSIHDQPKLKEEGLAEALVYDAYRRVSLVDHVLEDSDGLTGFARGELDVATFREHPCDIREEKGVLVCRSRAARGPAAGMLLEKRLAIVEHSVAVEYTLLNSGDGATGFRFGVEWNLTVLSAEAQVPGPVEEYPADRIVLSDPHLGYQATLAWSRPTGLWKAPVETVSLSESGIERVYQATSAMPVWKVVLEPGQEFSVGFTLSVEPHAPDRGVAT